MTAIPTGPLDREPGPLFLPEQERRRLLDHALQGVQLGAWDERIVAWLARMTDTSTISTVVSLIERARRAEAVKVAADLAGLRRSDGEAPLVTRPHDWPRP